LGGENIGSRDVALTVGFAGLYAALVIVLAPISFELVQVRVADALIPLSMIFGWPVIIGVSVGCAIANVASPMPSVVVDIVFGSLANFVASLLAWKISSFKKWNATFEFLGCVAATLTITLIVGTYLAVLTGMEVWLWWLGIGVGSVISICGIGFTLIQVLKRVLHESLKFS